MDYIKKTIELHNHFGKNDNYVQAAGGNISIKNGDIIHIKKSGLHFKDIKDEDDVISLNISKEDINQEVLSIKNKNNLENRYNEFIDQKNSGKGRPSIELSFHVFGDKYTLHLHPTLINIFTCTKEGQEIIKKMCEENGNMSYVDYYKPGIILTDEILKERSSLNDITFLFNHGIIVTGPSEDAIKERYKLVENALKKEIIYKEYKQEGELLKKHKEITGEMGGEQWFIINNNFLNEKGMENRAYLSFNTGEMLSLPHLYPDSVIYNARVFYQHWTDYSNKKNVITCHAMPFLEKSGNVFVWTMNVSSEKEAIFKIELFINKMKIEHFAKLNSFIPVYLDEKYVAELKNWDAEKYRQDLLK